MKHIRCALALLTTTTAAFAQDEAASVPTLPTTVVTGELWESELQKTTASITVLDDARIDTSGASHFEDLIPLIPNLTWTGGTSRPRYIQIRGIGENSQFEGETPDSSVRFVVDDLDFTGLGGVAGLFDVQQVEVLRGPQAGAFGANASGGLVRIQTNDPTPYWTGFVEGSAGTDNLRKGGLAVGGPLLKSDPEALTFRFAAHRHFSDGFIDNTEKKKDDTNERDEFMSRLKLRWSGTPDWQWDGTLFYADQDNGFDEFSLNNSDFETVSDEPGRDEQESTALSLRGFRQGNTVDFTTVSTATHADSLYSFDADWMDDTNPLSFNGFTKIDRNREVYSQEFRFDSTGENNALGWVDRWTVGLYLQSLEEDSDVLFDQRGSPLNAEGPFSANVDSTYESESAALFGQMAHHFSPAFRMTLGLRAEYHTVEVESTGTFVRPQGGEVEEDDLLFGGKLTFELELNPSHMAFISAARGYRAAGGNVAGFVPADAPLAYDDETLWNFESGLRSSLFDDQIQAKITFFYLHREDTQLRDSAGSGGFFTYFTDNGANAEHYGLEAEVTWQIARDWSASATLGLLESKREAFAGLPDERELSNAPAYTYNARLAYDAGGGFFANLGVSGRDEYFESNSHDEKRDAFTTVNAAIGYRHANWTLTFWGRNIFDEEYAKRVFFFDNTVPFDDADEQRFEALADPAQFGVTAKYTW